MQGEDQSRIFNNKIISRFGKEHIESTYGKYDDEITRSDYAVKDLLKSKSVDDNSDKDENSEPQRWSLID